ncbi:uncharacterized protein EV420DRAFT_254041 [Desarmillaria tabescens]|uniref:Uncharacterized protein n=1 Tax=Armillaria tabescens TaxID=1929756 RepID=A0AA39KFJ0_ARMTA|nr:uncharacterized protein EV420DRAFT_254041 [Desarmillaria tabescens]KAK0460165.1 hypothetical protein EV420DRAFT_254041 [Desarmillaria tabescens]
MYRSESLKSSYDLISSSPHLTPYIRTLKISGDAHGTLSMSELLPSFSALLTNVTRIELCGLTLPQAPEAVLYVRDVLHAHPLVSSVTISTCSLSIADINILLGQCAGLQHLKIARCSVFEDKETRFPARTSDVAYLQTLEIDGSTPSMLRSLPKWLLAGESDVSLSKLLTLKSSHLSASDVVVLNEVLAGTTESLERFELEHHDNSRPIYVNLSGHQHLTHIHIRSGFLTSTPEKWIRPVLATVGSRRVAEICIDLTLNRYHEAPLNWIGLDELLSSQRFCSLVKLDVRLRCLSAASDMRRGWLTCENVSRSMSSLGARGILNVELISQEVHLN